MVATTCNNNQHSERTVSQKYGFSGWYFKFLLTILIVSGGYLQLTSQVTISAISPSDLNDGESALVYVTVNSSTPLSSLSFSMTWSPDTACYEYLNLLQSLTLNASNFNRDQAIGGILGFTYSDTLNPIQSGDTLFAVQLTACGEPGSSATIRIENEPLQIGATGLPAGNNEPPPVTVLPAAGSQIGTFSIAEAAVIPVVSVQADDENCILPGETFDVCLTIDSSTAFNTLAFSLYWDTSVLRLISIDYAKDWQGMLSFFFFTDPAGILGFNRTVFNNNLLPGDTMFCLKYTMEGNRGDETTITFGNSPYSPVASSYTQGLLSFQPDTGSILSTLTLIEPPELLCKDVTFELPAEGKMKIEPDSLYSQSMESCNEISASVIPDSLFTTDIGTQTVTVIVEQRPTISDTCSATVVLDANGMPGPTAICKDLTVTLDSTGTVTIPADSLNNSSLYTGTLNMTLSQSTFTCADEGSNSVILQVTDDVRSDTCTSTVTIENSISLSISENLGCGNQVLPPVMANYAGGTWSTISAIGTTIDNSGRATLGKNLSDKIDIDTIVYTLAGCPGSILVEVLSYPQTLIEIEAGCPEDTLQLTESGTKATSWSWSGPDSFSSQLQNPVIEYAIPGWYSLTVTDSRSCTATDSIQMRGYPAINAFNGGPYCPGEIGRLYETGGDAVSWQWRFPSGFVSGNRNPAFSPVLGGVYIVSIADSSGCMISDTTEICVSQLQVSCPTLATIAIDTNGIAQPDIDALNLTSTGLSCSGTQSFSIAPPSFTCQPQEFQNATITVTDQYGCQDQCTMLVAIVDTNAQPLTECGCTGDDLFESGDIPEALYTASNKIESDGIVKSDVMVSFRAANNITLLPGFCANTGSSFSAQIGHCNPADGNLTEDSRSASLDTPDLTPDRSSLVWPNPFTDYCTISLQLANAATTQIRVLSIQGNLLDTVLDNALLSAGKHQIQLHPERLQTGTYLLVVETDNGLRDIHRLVKVR